MNIIDRLRELEKKATSGEWAWEQHGHDKAQMALYSGRDNENHGLRLFNANDGDLKYIHNLSLIAAMRNTLPKLLDVVEAAQWREDTLNVIYENGRSVHAYREGIDSHAKANRDLANALSALDAEEKE